MREYAKVTVSADGKLYRVYVKDDEILEIQDLKLFLESKEEPMIKRVCLSDWLNIDDLLPVIMLDETGLYFW